MSEDELFHKLLDSMENLQKLCAAPGIRKSIRLNRPAQEHVRLLYYAGLLKPRVENGVEFFSIEDVIEADKRLMEANGGQA